MKVLVINSGSSSIKYQLLAMPAGAVLARGLVQRIGEPDAQIEQQAAELTRITEAVPDHAVGLTRVVALLTEAPGAPLHSVDEIGAVGHRVVHGGEHFKDSALIGAEVMAAIEAHCELAPLHNPPNLLGIKVARALLPDVPQVAVFDTAFHHSLPPYAFHYAVPQSWYTEDKIRRYGFHGTSHKFVALRAAELLGRPLAELELITCHLGNGASIAALARGRVVDTSMGLTPLEGLAMGTRSGDIDPAIIFHLARTRGLSFAEIETTLNKRSGLLGLSGCSNDMRELLDERERGNADAALAVDVFCYRIKKYIGAYLAVLGRLDALIFTAGVGENAAIVRQEVCAGLEGLGIALDVAKNAQAIGVEADVSVAGVACRVLVVPTNEEKLIASDTYALAGAS